MTEFVFLIHFWFSYNTLFIVSTDTDNLIIDKFVLIQRGRIKKDLLHKKLVGQINHVTEYVLHNFFAFY